MRDFQHTVNVLVKAYLDDTLQHRLKDHNPTAVIEMIKRTGYSIEELMRIEFAFERGGYGTTDPMFNGLMACVDVLADIHNIDLTAKEEAKALFVKSEN